MPSFDISDHATFQFSGKNMTLLEHERRVVTLERKRIGRKRIEWIND
jgi:hypothetical protein